MASRDWIHVPSFIKIDTEVGTIFRFSIRKLRICNVGIIIVKYL
jgi:hypothetical protein